MMTSSFSQYTPEDMLGTRLFSVPLYGWNREGLPGLDTVDTVDTLGRDQPVAKAGLCSVSGLL